VQTLACDRELHALPYEGGKKYLRILY